MSRFSDLYKLARNLASVFTCTHEYKETLSHVRQKESRFLPTVRNVHLHDVGIGLSDVEPYINSCTVKTCKVSNQSLRHYYYTIKFYVGCGWLTTEWTVEGSNPGGDGVFCTRADRPWGTPSLLNSGYRVLFGGKSAEAWRWPPTPV
jgi:hypothetical protein